MRLSRQAKFLAVACAIAFVLTAVAALLFVSFHQELLVSSTYKNALESQQFYTRLPAIVAEQLVLGLDGNPCTDNPLRCANAKPELINCFKASLGERRYGILATGVEAPNAGESRQIQACVDQFQPDVQTANAGNGAGLSFFRLIKAQDLQKVITPLLQPGEVKPLADSFLDQFFSYLNGGQASITLDLTGIKKSLKGPGGFQTLLSIIRSQPQCTFQQLEQMLVITLTGKGNLVLCNPSTDLLNLLSPFIQSTLDSGVDAIPNSEVITPLNFASSQSFGPFGTGAVGAVRLTLTLMLLSPLLPLLFLLLITLLVVGTVKDFLRWWGIPLLTAGLLVVLVGLVGSSLFEPGWVTLLSGRIPNSFSVGLMGVVHDLLRAVLQTYWQDLMLLGAAVALPGLVMWIVSGLIKQR
jgi:hypothetical protein